MQALKMIIALLGFLLAATVAAVGNGTAADIVGMAVWTVPVHGQNVILYGTAEV